MRIFKRLMATVFGLMAMTAVAQAQDITVLYNGTPLKFNDAQPIVVEQRVMVPFRGVFEQMGIDVSYDEATRTASADCPNGGISFSIDESTIYYTESGAVAAEMDVLPVFVNGRTLIPLRAVSEASGMIVGWDGDESCVNIIDTDRIASQIEEQSADLTRLKTLAGVEVGSMESKVNYNAISGDGEKAAVSAAIKVNDRIMNADIEIDATVENMEKLVDVNDVKLDLVATDGVVYFRTDLVQKLQPLFGDDQTMLLISDLISPQQWYKSEVNGLSFEGESYLSGDDIARIISGKLMDVFYYEGYENSAAKNRKIPEEIALAAAEFDKLVEITDIDGGAEIRAATDETINETKVKLELYSRTRNGKIEVIEFKIEKNYKLGIPTDESADLTVKFYPAGTMEAIDIPEGAVDIGPLLESAEEMEE